MAAVEHAFGSTLLKASGVSLSLGGKQILRDVNLEIKDVRRPGVTTGQVVGLLGPSGMGKTQLFRILAGLNAPDRGTVLIGEEAVPVSRGLVGVVAQHYPLFNHRRVLGNLLVAGRHAGLSREAARAKAERLLAHFKLEDAASKFPLQLSGGQRQRVAIAQQFMCSERFLLMDEPFSGLDVVQIERVVRAVPRDHGHVDADVRGALDRRAKAAIRFRQVARPVVQVGQMRHPQAMRLEVRTVRSRTPIRDARHFRALRTGSAWQSSRRAHDATCCSSALTLSA